MTTAIICDMVKTGEHVQLLVCCSLFQCLSEKKRGSAFVCARVCVVSPLQLQLVFLSQRKRNREETALFVSGGIISDVCVRVREQECLSDVLNSLHCHLPHTDAHTRTHA